MRRPAAPSPPLSSLQPPPGRDSQERAPQVMQMPLRQLQLPETRSGQQPRRAGWRPKSSSGLGRHSASVWDSRAGRGAPVRSQPFCSLKCRRRRRPDRTLRSDAVVAVVLGVEVLVAGRFLAGLGCPDAGPAAREQPTQQRHRRRSKDEQRCTT
eukprot:scaffold4232_cov107-Isochrysis_galbana.AAC.7